MLYEEFLATAKKHESAADDFATISDYAKGLQLTAALLLVQVDHLIASDPKNLQAAFKAGEAAGKMEVGAQLLHHFAEADSDGPMDPMSDLDDIINSIRGGTAPERGTK